MPADRCISVSALHTRSAIAPNRVMHAALAFLLMLTMYVAPARSQWTQSGGPYGGWVHSLKISEERLFAATDGGGVFFSGDRAMTWGPFNTGLGDKRVRMLGVTATHIYAGTSSGLYASPLSTAAWQKVADVEGDTLVAAIAVRGDTIFTAEWHHGIFRSTNGGVTWENTSAGVRASEFYDFSVVGGLVFVGTDSGLFVSSDNGDNWIPGGLSGRGVKSILQKGSLVFTGVQMRAIPPASAPPAEVHFSPDSGRTWSVITGNLNVSQVYDLVEFEGSTEIVILTNKGVYASSDTGRAWNPLYTSYPVRTMAVDGADIFLGTDGDIIHSTDTWANTDKRNNGLIATRVRSIARLDENLYAGTAASGMFVSTDGGGTWLSRNSGLTGTYFLSMAAKGSLVFTGTRSSRVFVTPDTLWSSAGNGLPTKQIYSLAPKGSDLYAGTELGVYKTSDDGQNWSQVSGGVIDTTVFTVSPFGLTRMLAGHLHGVVTSTDNGATWSDISVGLPDAPIRGLTAATTNVFAGGDSGVYRASAPDFHWSRAGTGLPDTIVYDILASVNSLFAATASGVFLSTDGGEFWTDWSEGMNNKTSQVLFLDGDDLLAGTVGGGIERRTLPPAKPLLVSPDPRAMIQTPAIFSWSASQRANAYQLEISTDSLFRVAQIVVPDLQGTSWQSGPLAYHTVYYWRVRASGVGGNSSYSETRSFSTESDEVFSGQTVHDFPADPVSTTDYRLVSFPGMGLLMAGDLLPGSQGADWKMFRDNGDAPPDHLTELSAADSVILGQGYWLVHRGPLTFSQTVTMPPLRWGGYCNVNIDSGWNIVGVPFGSPISVAAIRTINQDSALVFYSYEGRGGYQDTLTVLQPFRGYYMYNSSGRDSLYLPYLFPGMSVAGGPAPSIEWSLSVVLHSASGVEDETTLGISRSARVGFDRLDKYKPPSLFGDAGVYFHRMEWDGRYSRFTSDFRPPFEDGAVWEFNVRAGGEEPATLRIEGVDQISAELEVRLVDVADSVFMNARRFPAYTFLPRSNERTFRLLIGTLEFVENQGSVDIPSSFGLLQNFPNPFNPATSIRYAVPRDAHIRIEVYSLLGQRIALLTDELHTPGSYVRLWDGKNADGGNAASGVYFYRMAVDGVPLQTHKMLMLR